MAHLLSHHVWNPSNRFGSPLPSGWSCQRCDALREPLLVYVLFFPFSPPFSCKHTPWVLDQSCEHKVPLHNLSLKAIIIRSFRLSHRGNMRSAFIRQMEHGCSGLQWALGYDTGGYIVWMIDRDGLDLGQDHVIWLEGWDEDGGSDTRDGWSRGRRQGA